jgi:putative tryptophan/tyrosine transport system substrate-binding protein
MKRREFIGFLAVAVASPPIVAFAQVPTKRPLIAVLSSGSPTTTGFQSGLLHGLQELGYLEGRDYEIQYRYMAGDVALLPALVDELIRLKPNVIVAGNSAAAVAAKQATESIPIVAAAIFDPVSLGLAASPARPGGNVTGVVAGWDTVVGKQVELGLELIPGAKLVGMLVHVDFPPASFLRRGAEIAAHARTTKFLSVEVHAATDFDPHSAL